ncbi:MAG TPA: NlpC/P60 family protein, partial [Myxococcaceae bacterium]|nr:NlpC/P60 family protein [Myxococcaceae bacterium]
GGGFDCSGLVQQAFKAIGNPIIPGAHEPGENGRSTTLINGKNVREISVQEALGNPKDPNSGIPGALVYMEGNGGIPHIGISLGGGMVLESAGGRGCVINQSAASNWDRGGIVEGMGVDPGALDLSGVPVGAASSGRGSSGSSGIGNASWSGGGSNSSSVGLSGSSSRDYVEPSRNFSSWGTSLFTTSPMTLEMMLSLLKMDMNALTQANPQLKGMSKQDKIPAGTQINVPPEVHAQVLAASAAPVLNPAPTAAAGTSAPPAPSATAAPPSSAPAATTSVVATSAPSVATASAPAADVSASASPSVASVSSGGGAAMSAPSFSASMGIPTAA